MLKRVPEYVNNKRTLALYLFLLFINTLPDWLVELAG